MSQFIIQVANWSPVSRLLAWELYVSHTFHGLSETASTAHQALPHCGMIYISSSQKTKEPVKNKKNIINNLNKLIIINILIINNLYLIDFNKLLLIYTK